MSLEQLNASNLGLQPNEFISKTQVLKQYLPSKKEAGKILSGEIPDQVEELARLLRADAKAI